MIHTFFCVFHDGTTQSVDSSILVPYTTLQVNRDALYVLVLANSTHFPLLSLEPQYSFIVQTSSLPIDCHSLVLLTPPH